VKVEREKQVKKGGFTIIELLTVMSIIILLISLLVPALTRVRRYAQFVKQKAQFHAMSIALDLFNSEQGNYPPSDRLDTNPGAAPAPFSYCGAMKLAEALVGQDLRGFNPSSIFRRDGIDANGVGILYPVNPGAASAQYPDYIENIKSRRLYLQLENANAFKLTDIYSAAHLGGSAYANILTPPTNDPNFVLCDVYVRSMITGKKTGMPILYYKADTSKVEHNPALVTTCATPNNNIYSRCDNQELVDIPLPWITYVAGSSAHPMASSGNTQLNVLANPDVFYTEIQDPKGSVSPRPYRADSYILMSAGYDGEYGTKDDVFNFGE
jgi:type II secretory pathway pseudopilin PulG